MKKLTLFMFAISMSSFVYAQTNALPSTGIGGSFFITQTAKEGNHSFNVGYSLTPSPLTTELNLRAQAWEETMLGFKIRNSRNEIVMTWKPEQHTKLFIHQFDISNLPAGSYKLDIYGPNGNLVKTVNFQKQKQ